MRVVRYLCGCVVLGDSTLDPLYTPTIGDAIILERCDGPNDEPAIVFQYNKEAVEHLAGQTFVPMSEGRERHLLSKVASIIIDGHTLEDVRGLIEGVK